MHVIFNVFGLYAEKAKSVFGAFVSDDSGTYFAAMVDGGWSGSLDLPDAFRTQRDVRSTAQDRNARVDGTDVATASIRGFYRQEWCAKRGEWTLEDLANLGHISMAQYNAIVVYYGLEAEAAA